MHLYFDSYTLTDCFQKGCAWIVSQLALFTTFSKILSLFFTVANGQNIPSSYFNFYSHSSETDEFCISFLATCISFLVNGPLFGFLLAYLSS